MMDGIGFQNVNISGQDAESILGAAQSAAAAQKQSLPPFADFSDYFSVPRTAINLARHAGISPKMALAWLHKHHALNNLVRTAYGQYGRADHFDAAPVDQIIRPRPVYDALLAYLVEPRHAVEIASHIDSTVPIATGHMTRLMRQGVVVRVAYGVYLRKDRCPNPPAADALLRGRPIRDRVAAALDREMSLAAVMAKTGQPGPSVKAHLTALVRERVIERVGPDHFRPVPPDLFNQRS